MTGNSFDEALQKSGLQLTDPQLASVLDAADHLSHLRSEFNIPTKADLAHGDDQNTGSQEDSVYFCGNSLGLLPKRTEQLVKEELQVWSKKGVHGHFSHAYSRPWVTIDNTVVSHSATLVGARVEEIALMNSLTANLHFLMVSFYSPDKGSGRVKILMEGKAFPSDYYAIESQVKFHGLNPSDTIIQVYPREGEHTLRTEDILSKIREHGHEVALVLFSGIQYYTGQFFDIQKITHAGHEKGCKVGFDLAHAVGNVPLSLHDWNVDFACWCTYKYVNAGPGGIGGAFVHSKWINDQSLPKLTGWWGTDPVTKFQMDNIWRPIPSAQSYRLSNPNVLATVSLLGSLQVFSQTSMPELRKKSLLLTGYLSALLSTLPYFRVITPSAPSQRGCQLSLLFDSGAHMEKVFSYLEKSGVVVDERRPDVIRVAPVPMYNTFTDVFVFYRLVKEGLEQE